MFIKDEHFIWVNPFDGGSTLLDPNGAVIRSGNRNIRRAAPRIAAPWDVGPGWFDQSQNGWILGRKEMDPAIFQFPTLALMPLFVEDDAFAHGVDSTSLSAFSPDQQAMDRYWIMVPAGDSPANETSLRTPASTEVPITLTAPPGVLMHEGGGAGGASLVLVDDEVSVGWTSTNAASADLDLTITIGSVTANPPANSISQPVGLKVMKKRTVLLHVHHITQPGPGGAPLPMLTFEDGATITDALDAIFLPQVNIDFEVIALEGAENPATPNFDVGIGNPAGDGDTAGNGALDVIDENAPPNEVNDLGDEIDAIKAGRIGPVAHIHVFFVGGQAGGFPVYNGNYEPYPSPLGGDVSAAGIADISGNCVFVLARDGDDPGETLHTLAHEIGHVMIGPGHPGSPGSVDAVAALFGTDRSKRLMYGGPQPDPVENTLLVKGEWDKIESWLQINVDGQP